MAEKPQYVFTETAYGLTAENPRLHRAGEEISTWLPPGPHMKPLNAAARKARRKADAAIKAGVPVAPDEKPEVDDEADESVSALKTAPTDVFGDDDPPADDNE